MISKNSEYVCNIDKIMIEDKPNIKRKCPFVNRGQYISIRKAHLCSVILTEKTTQMCENNS